jgi:hypothetical protein
MCFNIRSIERGLHIIKFKINHSLFEHYLEKLKSQPKWIIKIHKKKSKNVRNAIPRTYSPLTQSSINLEKYDVVLGDNNNMRRTIGRKIMKKQVKKDKGTTKFLYWIGLRGL